jgi:outer membrane protein insertion porin family
LIFVHRLRQARPCSPSARGLLLAALLALAAGPAAAQGAARDRAQDRERSDLVVRQLEFKGNESLSPVLLAASIATTNSGWFARTWPFRTIGLGERRYFSEVDFQRDVLRLQVLYRQSGFPDVQVDTLVRRTAEDVYITFTIAEGQPVLVDSIAVGGLDSVPPEIAERVVVDLPLQRGDVFNRIQMQASADTISRRLRNAGYPTAEVLVGYEQRTAERLASVTLDVQPGRRAVIGAVRVDGEADVDSATVVSLLTARPGRTYSQDELFESQRNLYGSDLFRLASVNIDTSLFLPGSDSVPLLVQVAENPPRRGRLGAGYGTNDCFRGNAGIMFRDFLGEGRILDLSGRVSKFGIGRPTNWGFENNVCSPLADDSIGSHELNYNVTAAIRRPAFLSPNNTLVLSAFTEIRSEFKVFLRQETGFSIGINRQTPMRRLPVSLTYTLAFGRTEATDFSFCAFFNACEPEDAEFLAQRRRQATLSLTGSIPRANNPLDPTRGYVATGELTVASRLIGSSSLAQFGRGVVQYARYHPMARDVVFSWHVQGGVIVAPTVELLGGTSAYVPPEQRFYGGGPNDVRGYQRNELGPVVYVVSRRYLNGQKDPGRPLNPDSVRVAPTGGNTMASANAELRFPSPIFRERLRIATFVDAGTVWERGRTDPIVRVTPGIGLRIATPLGPARLDLAYNPASLLPGTLYVVEQDNTLTVDTGRTPFALNRPGSFTVHFAVGQPF